MLQNLDPVTSIFEAPDDQVTRAVVTWCTPLRTA